MNKSELIEKIAEENPHLSKRQVEFIVNGVFNSIKSALESDEKVEIRGFGSFKVRKKNRKEARNPKTGEKVIVEAKSVPYFKPSREIKLALLK
ncbi:MULTISPECIES: HU family DNA-binding protein [Calditerrivibrio]|jgi:integration host factor subunit beta|uniref:Histone family protein DNA-binding protein n=2 Tax=Calditerrivibrio nitroreducens TaxID=477976 RepID=E4TEF9_CALNY|nr:HU family DNA-binding protein [Calditerrivibrio nitroreducens]ADR18285.1 histone family protein DNA-binding protein [Calditerrivibrio nitroreducens DSM 19672]PMP71374.1 MAG: integration host factor subunit beta [Calditerrivibrio nitroreducens]